MRRIRVYVAGPLTGSGIMTHNIADTIEIANTLYDNGLIPFVPHLFSLWDIACPRHESVFLELDRNWLAACDVMYRREGISPGTDKEAGWAEDMKIPIYTDLIQLIDDARLDRILRRGV